MTVIAGTSSRLYENTPKRTRDICRELGVDAVLEGTVQRGQGRVRVNVALVDGRTERRLRAVSSERESGNVLDLYADVARQVAAGPRPGVQDEGPDRRRAVNPEAYERLPARPLPPGPAAGGRLRARRAVSEGGDPAGPGACRGACRPRLLLRVRSSRRDAERGEGAALGRAEAERALALEARLPQAHVALGLLQHRFDYDWVGAERSLKRAWSWTRTRSTRCVFYAELLYLSGRRDEGMAMFRQRGGRRSLPPGSQRRLRLRALQPGVPGRIRPAVQEGAGSRTRLEPRALLAG